MENNPVVLLARYYCQTCNLYLHDEDIYVGPQNLISDGEWSEKLVFLHLNTVGHKTNAEWEATKC